MRDLVSLDTNILLDYVFGREPFFDEAVGLFQFRSDDKLEFYLSSLSLANLVHWLILRIMYNVQKDPRPIINILLEWVHVIALDKAEFLQTTPSAFTDFEEDGLQYFSALTIQDMDAIITRNKKDYAPASIPVLTAGEYLERYKQNQ